ncbi:MAG: hypothetical protein NZ837_11730 [Gammaproteobacteria bacterium]|nr:hypothetical protein [Gammaproteobacteria bacterium]
MIKHITLYNRTEHAQLAGVPIDSLAMTDKLAMFLYGHHHTWVEIL